MKRLNLFLIIVILSLPIAKADSEKKAKIEDNFKVNWGSIQYNKNVALYNPEVSSNQRKSSSSENFRLNCQIEILDPNLVIGTCEQAVITQITDSKGQVIDTGPEFPDIRSMRYSGLRYDSKMVMPEREPKWKEVIDSVLRLERQRNMQPQRVFEIRPSGLQIQLDKDVLEELGNEIGSIKGYFYILSAQSMKNIDVPFEPSEDWIRLTNYHEIKINEVKLTGNRINFEIEEYRPDQNRMNSLNVNDYLPQEFVTARRFLKADGELSNHFLTGLNSIPAHVGGSGSMSGGDTDQIKKVRFVIAQDPNHVKIPFEIKNIPIPKP